MNCSICREGFDEIIHKPHTLNPCGHCFCSKCISTLSKRECPECREKIKSEIINYGILNLLSSSRPSTLPPNPERETKIFKSLENALNEMDELKKNLADTLKKKQTECRDLIEDMKKKIQKETEHKINRLLNDNQKLQSELDILYQNVVARLNNLSLTEKLETDLDQFEQDFSCLSLSELSQNSNRLKSDVRQRIINLDDFKLNVTIGFKPNTDENQIGKLLEKDTKITSFRIIKPKDKPLKLENRIIPENIYKNDKF